MDRVTTDAPDQMHPAWCSPPNCTALRGVHGTHRGENVTITLASYVLTLYVELGRPMSRGTTEPLVVVEERTCACLDCEPIAVIGMRVAQAREFLAGLTQVVEDLDAA